MRPQPLQLIILESDSQEAHQKFTQQTRWTQQKGSWNSAMAAQGMASSSRGAAQSLPRKRHEVLGIHQLQHPKQPSHSPSEKLMKCNKCHQRVSNYEPWYKCPRCATCLHWQCMDRLDQCPKCHLKLASKTLQTTLGKQGQLQDSNCRDQQNKIQKEQESVLSKRIIRIEDLSKEHQQQAIHFVEKYSQITDGGHILLPIEEHLINSHVFLRAAVNYQTLPDCQWLPSIFEDLIEVWNFFAYFSPILECKSICGYFIDNFEQKLRAERIQQFLIPLIEIYSYSECKNASKLYFLLQDSKQVNTIGVLANFFWPSILLELIAHEHPWSQDQPGNLIVGKLNELCEKRSYEITDFEQKLQVLKVTIGLVSGCGQFKAYVDSCAKYRIEQHAESIRELNHKKQAIAERNYQINEQMKKIQQMKEKEGPVANDQYSSMDKKRAELLRERQGEKKKLTEVRESIKAAAKINEIQGCNRVVYLGKDRADRCYWHIPNSGASDIVFLSQQQSQKSGIVQKWGFYHGQMVYNLTRALNEAGLNECRLKESLNRLIELRVIRKNSSQRMTAHTQPVKKLQPFEQRREQPGDQYKSGREFLQGGVKEINLTQLRKILIQIHRLTSECVKRRKGMWKESKEYEQKTRGQKFKNLNEIKNFVVQFSKGIRQVNHFGERKGRGRQALIFELWSNRDATYQCWVEALKASSKNTQVFMLVTILYLEVVKHTSQLEIRRTNYKIKSAKIASKTAVKKTINSSNSSLSEYSL